MKTYLVALGNIRHPESRKVLIVEGGIYTVKQIEKLAQQTGMDNIKGYLCIGYAAAQNMNKRIVNSIGFRNASWDESEHNPDNY